MAALAVVIASAAFAACGVRTQSDAERISARDVPFGLTKQTPPSTAVTAGSEATIFLIRNARLSAVARNLAEFTPNEAITTLLRGPTPEEGRAGYTSAVPASARLNGVHVRDGTAIVDLNGEFLQGNVGDSTLGIGQLVRTLAQFPGIASVRFELDGERVAVPKGDGTITKGPLTTSDFPVPE